MKYILSAIGESISFNLSSNRKLIIDTIIPIQVSELEFKILQERLGTQIMEVSVATSEPAPETTVEETVVTETEQEAEIAPETESEPEMEEEVEEEIAPETELEESETEEEVTED